MYSTNASARSLNQSTLAAGSADSGTAFYFCLVDGRHDQPIFELESAALTAALSQRAVDPGHRNPNNPWDDGSEQRYMAQFIAHAALDAVDDAQWQQAPAYLRVVDRFNDWMVSAYVTSSNARLLLLHDQKNEDGIKSFFMEVHELFVKLAMNPFYEPGSPIQSSVFEQRVRQSARKHLH